MNKYNRFLLHASFSFTLSYQEKNGGCNIHQIQVGVNTSLNKNKNLLRLKLKSALKIEQISVVLLI
jgi:hypothetical protein